MMRGPWRHRDFRLIWAGGLVNDTGDWLLMVALPAYVLVETGSGLTTALLVLAQLVPTALLGSHLGNLVDRWDLRRTVVATNVAQAVTLLPLLAVTADRTWPAFVVAGAQSVLTRFNNPANAALLVRVVPPAELGAANAARAASENVARLVGSPLGGIVVAVGGLPAVVVVDGLSFLCVALATAAVRADASPAPRHDEAGIDARRTAAGLRVLARTRPFPALLATMTISQVAQGMFVVLFLVFVVRRLGGGEADVGMVRGMQAVGGILGGLLLARRLSSAPVAALLGVGFGGMAAWGFVMWNLPGLTTAIAVYAVVMALAGPFAVTCSVGVTTGAQVFPPPGYLGLGVGTLEAAGAIGQGIGALAAGVLVDRVELAWLLNGQAMLYVATAAIGWRFVRRSPDDQQRAVPGHTSVLADRAS
ncbi:MAG: MFS transporter [Ilumatobacteraceae bacterium]